MQCQILRFHGCPGSPRPLFNARFGRLHITLPPFYWARNQSGAAAAGAERGDVLGGCVKGLLPKQGLTMGIVLSRVFQALFGSKEVRILILGLDNAGKTTILYRLQNEADDNIQTIPTIGFNVETLQYKNIKFQVNFLISFLSFRRCQRICFWWMWRSSTQ